MAAVLAPQLAPKERIIAAGPVPSIAERIGVTWHKVSVLDRKNADQFFGSLEQSDASFFLVLDEADSFLGASAYYSKPLQEFLRDGRNFGQGGLLIGHSVGEVSKSFINNCDIVMFGRSSVPGTTDWLRKYTRDEPYPVPEIVANLGEHQFLVYAPKETPKTVGIAKSDPTTGEINIHSIEEITGSQSARTDAESGAALQETRPGGGVQSGSAENRADKP